MGETEKITINMGVVDLGKVDLLVKDGFYQNRTDFIRTAIRNQLSTHVMEVKDSVTRNMYALGIFDYSNDDLKKDIAEGIKRKYHVIGMMILEEDVTPEVADNAIESVMVRGIFRAPEAVKKILADRIR